MSDGKSNHEKSAAELHCGDVVRFHPHEVGVGYWPDDEISGTIYTEPQPGDDHVVVDLEPDDVDNGLKKFAVPIDSLIPHKHAETDGEEERSGINCWHHQLGDQ